MRRILRHRLARALLSIVLAAALWLPTLHLWFERAPEVVADGLAARQLALWSGDGGAERAVLRRTNPEWDLMARLFAALAFANLALAEPAERERYAAAIDRILDETLREEAERGHHHFLLPYSRRGRFRDVEQRSLFVDGEIALMLAARQMIDPDAERGRLLRSRIDRIAGQLERSPLLVGESYPDEVWIFCNAVALAAIRLHDVSSGADHSALLARWITAARSHLAHDETGLLVSSATWDGAPLDGPEGSTIWLVSHLLLLVDAGFARDQYERARGELGATFLGFAWAREWPASWNGTDDVDSGPTVPIVEANAGSSGLALVAARSFGDREFLDGLVASLELAGFPIDAEGGRRYAAGNALADAVILYGLVCGPLWERAGVREGTR
jgi:hypothetical protein